MSESSKSKSSLNLNPAPTLQCKDLHEYLKSRSAQFLETLYNYPTICLAVYRELPELARHFVIRLLFVEQPVPQAVVASWVSQAHAKEQIKAAEALSELSVWQDAPIPGGLPGWMLAQSFKKNLKVALLGGGRPWSMSMSLEPDGKARDVAFLDAYASERWECVLHYMVGSAQTEGISADAVRILLHAGLMTRDAEDGSAVITRAGFQFLLLSTAKQVWLFLQHYLHTAEKRSLSAAECLAFLYQLSFSTLGKDYSTEGMSNNMLVFLQHLREFGLVYQRKRKAGRFYPTRLALNIASVRGDAEISQPAATRGYIVVETNYRVYAYTQTSLQAALLGLFAELVYRFPNLVVGVLTRDSIRQALRGGITASQIIKYLEQHAHPQVCPNN
ncbi:general transcription factor IIH subunit 4 isoform X2 [Cydia pomonella]|uniref:general transcription factor IIH subunit 4 isoform X2 n=1 Tax=Cydia pomonella TaxID=82600 RepID=UPI002ADDB4A7|nr:general transcription factor IIH subunit 4 isoform X2 [Cydia pomonella]